MMKRLLLIILPLLIMAGPAWSQERKTGRKKAKEKKELVLKQEESDDRTVTRLEAPDTDKEIELTDTLTNEYLDSLKITKDLKINDYTMIGFQYGAGLSQVFWNPKQDQKLVFIPVNVGITWTRYGKMFNYMPYFGIQAGFFYGREGYQLKQDDEKPGYNHVAGAGSAIIDMIEIPVMAHCHMDFWKMKVILNLGLYGGYRLKIKRNFLPQFENNMDYWQWENKFKPTDNRFDFGIKGGVGFGFVFDPVEIHITAMYKHSLSSLYQPDYASKYYYRYAYPSNIIISAGVHFQLTKRVGKTKMQLKRQAKLDAYGKNEDTDSKGRKR